MNSRSNMLEKNLEKAGAQAEKRRESIMVRVCGCLGVGDQPGSGLMDWLVAWLWVGLVDRLVDARLSSQHSIDT